MQLYNIKSHRKPVLNTPNKYSSKRSSNPKFKNKGAIALPPKKETGIQRSHTKTAVLISFTKNKLNIIPQIGSIDDLCIPIAIVKQTNIFTHCTLPLGSINKKEHVRIDNANPFLMPLTPYPKKEKELNIINRENHLLFEYLFKTRKGRKVYKKAIRAK